MAREITWATEGDFEVQWTNDDPVSLDFIGLYRAGECRDNNYCYLSYEYVGIYLIFVILFVIYLTFNTGSGTSGTVTFPRFSEDFLTNSTFELRLTRETSYILIANTSFDLIGMCICVCYIHFLLLLLVFNILYIFFVILGVPLYPLAANNGMKIVKRVKLWQRERSIIKPH